VVIKLEVIKSAPDLYQVFIFNRPLTTKVGNFIMGEDGFFQFWPAMRSGYWSSWLLREVAAQLDILNKEWEDEIERQSRN
jgi:hypothetical protein